MLGGMDSGDRRMLEELREAQRELRTRLEVLDRKLASLEEKIAEPIVEKSAAPPVAERIHVAPPPLPRAVTPPAPRPAWPALEPAAPLVSLPPQFPAPPPQPERSFEFQLGSVWLVRIGMVLLLTALVFLGNWAYQQYHEQIGPVGKLGLLALAGSALSGFGGWLERREEGMRNYARVVLGGGLATLYYATYAAHFVAGLRVISSPEIGGVLLLLVAAGIVWIAERRRSETIALGAILLSYYTSALNPVRSFSLLANLLLTAAAVTFLVRNRWAKMSLASLLAAYAHFGWTQWFGAGVDHDGLAPFSFLAAIWVLFTVGAFFSAPESFPRGTRAAFASLNNAALLFFGVAILNQTHPEARWLFCTIYGAALLGLAWFAARKMPAETFLDGALLAQGLGLLSLGVVAETSGYQTSLVLAAESAILLSCGRGRHGWIFDAGAMLAAGLSFCGVVWSYRMASVAPIPRGLLELVLFLYDARWTKRLAGAEKRWSAPAAIYSGLALAVGGILIFEQVKAEPLRVVVLALLAVALAVTMAWHGLPELALLAQGYLVAGHVGVQVERLPWWSPAIVLMATVILSWWWQKWPGVPLSTRQARGIELLFAIGAVALLQSWLGPLWPEVTWTLVAAALALAFLLYGLATKQVVFGIAGQWFAGVTAWWFFAAVAGENRPFWGTRLGAVEILIACSLLLPRLLAQDEHRGYREMLARGYQVVAALMLITWTFQYLPKAWQFFFLVAVAVGLLALAGWRKSAAAALFAAGLAMAGLGAFWFGGTEAVSVPGFVAILLLLAAQRGLKKTALGPAEINAAIIGLALASLWLLLWRWTQKPGVDLPVTLAWSLAAPVIFGLGIYWRERAYRLGGLAVLATAIGHILLVDVWRLESLYRILSLFAAAGALLLLGFLYNRHGEKWKAWL